MPAASRRQRRLEASKNKKIKAKTHNVEAKHCKRQNTSNIKGIKLLLSSKEDTETVPRCGRAVTSSDQLGFTQLVRGCSRRQHPSPAAFPNLPSP